MINPYVDFGFNKLSDWMREHDMKAWADVLELQVDSGLSMQRFGDLNHWIDAYTHLPKIEEPILKCDDEIKISSPGLNDQSKNQLSECLEAMIPWRKGPYDICGIKIDTEWRSDMKWQRIKQHIQPLKSKNVIDIGCGNGYHMWRMLGEQAAKVIGVDPSPRFSIQFEMIKKLAGAHLPVHLVPAPLETIPRPLEAFDTAFSMGVLYHRRSPIDHLIEIKDLLKPGGEVVLESIVVEGDVSTCLIPEERYGKMRNVWFIPSSKMMMLWLQKAGFKNIKLVNEQLTTVEEQRRTAWMKFESLGDFLNPEDPTLTIEGYPAPRRAVAIANKPD